MSFIGDRQLNPRATKPYYTLDDINTDNKVVLLRIDINSPLNPETGEILDDSKFKSHKKTIYALENSKVVLLAHQSRPAKKDFTTLKSHTDKLEEVLNKPIEYVEDIIGKYAREKIKNMANGEIILLENVRFLSEEIMDMPPEMMTQTIFVKTLSRLADFYINDAFAVSHRAQPSIVGFPLVMPSAAGLLMEKEIKELSLALENNSYPVTFVFGGSKVLDTLKVVKNILNGNKVDKILLTGVVANFFLFSKGINIGEPNIEYLKREGFVKYKDEAKTILKESAEKIILPVDVAIKKDRKREDISIESLPTDYQICDIGIETFVKFSKLIKEAEIVILNGPAGIFEEKDFAYGTYEILRAAGEAKHAIIGGGHTASVAHMLDLEKKVSHISTGGGASIEFLSGEKLLGIDALEKSKTLFKI